MVKKFLMQLLLVAVTFSLIGCVRFKDDNTFEYVGLQVYDQNYIALEKGFFEKHNVNFKLSTIVAGGSQAIQMVSKGKVDGGLNSIMALSNAINANEKVIGVMDLQSAKVEEPLERFFIKKEKVPEGWEELDIYDKAFWLYEQRIAVNLVGSSFYYTWDYLFRMVGKKLNPAKLRILPFADQLIAIENDAVDIVSLMSPYSSKLLNDDRYYEITNAIEIFGEKQFVVVFVNSDLAKRNPDLIKRYVTALNEAIDWAKENQEEAKEIISKYTGIDKDLILDYYWQDNGMVVMEDVKFWKDFLKYDNLKTEDIATNKFNLRVN